VVAFPPKRDGDACVVLSNLACSLPVARVISRVWPPRAFFGVSLFSPQATRVDTASLVGTINPLGRAA